MINMIIDTTKVDYFLYTRRSSDREDRQVQSIPAQKKELIELSKYFKLKIVKIFQEDKSAKQANQRPIFNDMMNRIEQGEANGLLCWDVDRLSRNYRDAGWVQDLLNESVIKSIRTPRKEYLPSDDLVGLCVESSNAAEYSKKLSINVKRGFKQKRERGWFPHRAPIGYINIKKDDENIISNDPQRFNLVQKMWGMVLSGNYSISDIEEIADKKWGFRTRKTKRMGGVKLTKARLYEMFSNPFYKGIYAKNVKEYAMKHNKMVSEGEWDKIQYLIGKKNKPRSKKHNFAFRGPIFCGECGCLITAEIKPKKIISTGELKKYTYYHCTRRKKDIKCSQNKSIREDILEAQIIEELGKVTIDPEFTEMALEVLHESHAKEVKIRKSIFVNLENTYEGIEKKLNRLTDMRLNEQITDEEYNLKKQELLKEKSTIKRQMDNYDHRVDNWLELTERAFNFASNARARFITGTPEIKRTILRALGTKITLSNGEIKIEPKKWLVPIAENYPALKKQYEMLEPEKTHHNEGRKRVLTGHSFDLAGERGFEP